MTCINFISISIVGSIVYISACIFSNVMSKKVTRYSDHVKKFRYSNFIDGEIYEVRTKYRHSSSLSVVDMVYCMDNKIFFSNCNYIFLRELKDDYHYVEIKHKGC